MSSTVNKLNVGEVSGSGFNFKTSVLICSVPILFFLIESLRVNSFSSLALVIMHHFNINAYLYAKISSAYLWGNIIFLIPFGLLLDRFSSKSIIFTAVLICISSNVALGLSRNYQQTLIFSFIAGMGASAGFILAAKLIKEWFPPRYLAFMVGILVSSAMVGGILAQTPVLYFIQHYSWRMLFFVLALLEILILIMSLIFVTDKKSAPIKDSTKQSLFQTIKNLWYTIKCPVNWIGGLFASLMNLPVTLIGALWGQPYLQTVDHLSAATSSFIVSLMFIGVIIGSPLVRSLSDKFQSRKLFMLLGAVITLILSLSIVYIAIKSAVILSIIFLLLGLASSVQSLGYTVVSENNPLHRIGVAMSFTGMTVMCGGALLQPYIGRLLDQNRLGAAENVLQYGAVDFQHAFTVFPISFTIALLLVLALWVKDKRVRWLSEYR